MKKFVSLALSFVALSFLPANAEIVKSYMDTNLSAPSALIPPSQTQKPSGTDPFFDKLRLGYMSGDFHVGADGRQQWTAGSSLNYVNQPWEVTSLAQISMMALGVAGAIGSGGAAAAGFAGVAAYSAAGLYKTLKGPKRKSSWDTIITLGK